MGLVYSEPWQLVKQLLLNRLTAAALPGGELDGLTIETVCPPESGQTMSLGFQFRSSADDESSGQGRTIAVFTFEFNVLIDEQFDPQHADAVKQVTQTAENLWNDQAGNGLGAVLNEDLELNGIVYRTTINHQIVTGRDVTDESHVGAVIVAQMICRAERNTYA